MSQMRDELKEKHREYCNDREQYERRKKSDDCRNNILGEEERSDDIGNTLWYATKAKHASILRSHMLKSSAINNAPCANENQSAK